MRITIDSREPKEILDLWSELGVEYEVARLELGDFVLGDTAIERKSYPDFIASLIDGRLFSQAMDLKDNFKHIALLISGNKYVALTEYYEGRKKRGYDPRSLSNSIDGAIAALIYMGVPVFNVDGDRELVNLAHRIFLRMEKVPEEYMQKVVRKTASLDERRMAAVGCVQGIGATRARMLLECAGSIAKLCTMTSTDFQRCGLNQKLAVQLEEFLRGEFGARSS